MRSGVGTHPQIPPLLTSVWRLATSPSELCAYQKYLRWSHGSYCFSQRAGTDGSKCGLTYQKYLNGVTESHSFLLPTHSYQSQKLLKKGL
jgi:hypothetical protein